MYIRMTLQEPLEDGGKIHVGKDVPDFNFGCLQNGKNVNEN